MSASTLTGRSSQLPHPLTPLIGREMELKAVCTLISRDSARLITLTGPGGVGKTRLALAVAARLESNFVHGVVFVPMATVRDPAFVLQTIAHRLNLPDVGASSLESRLTAYLRERQLLLIVDNVEQVVEGAPALGALLEDCAGIKALVTSRTPLRISGEQAFPVLPLSVPPESASLEDLERCDAVSFFVSRYIAMRPDFALTPENSPAVAEICRRLDGLPLALELAAARANLYSPEAIAQRLDHKLPLLAGGARDLPDRLRSLRGTIAWSYELLLADQQAMFRRLSIFQGGFTDQAAEDIAHVEPVIIDEVMSSLSALVDHGLLKVEHQPDGSPRFVQLETIREYGLELLEANHERGAIAAVHAEFFLALAEQAKHELWGPTQAHWLEVLDVERPNLRAALDWFLEHGPAEMPLQMIVALSTFWKIRGRLSEGRTQFERALEGSENTDPAIRGEAVCAGGTIAALQGRVDEAFALAGQALLIAQAGNYLSMEGRAYFALSYAEGLSGDPNRSSLRAREALDRFLAAGDFEWTAAALNRLAVTMVDRKELEDAAALYEESLALCKRLGNVHGIALILDGLAQIAQQRGEPAESLRLRKETLRISRDLGDLCSTIEALIGIADLASSAADFVTTTQLLGAAEAIANAIGFSVYSFPRAN